jgi:hypothetical protein
MATLQGCSSAAGLGGLWWRVCEAVNPLLYSRYVAVNCDFSQSDGFQARAIETFELSYTYTH